MVSFPRSIVYLERGLFTGMAEWTKHKLFYVLSDLRTCEQNCRCLQGNRRTKLVSTSANSPNVLCTFGELAEWIKLCGTQFYLTERKWTTCRPRKANSPEQSEGELAELGEKETAFFRTDTNVSDHSANKPRSGLHLNKVNIWRVG